MREYFLIVLVALCSFKSQAAVNNDRDTTLRMLTYGFRDVLQDRAQNTVAKKYGFQYYMVAGCVVTQELMDSVARENKVTDSILEKKFGKTWRTRFEAEVKKVRHMQMMIEKMIVKEKYIIEKENELNKKDRGLNFTINPLPDGKLWMVNAYAWESWEDEAPTVYYKIKVDPAGKKVELLSSQPEKMIVH